MVTKVRAAFTAVLVSFSLLAACGDSNAPSQTSAVRELLIYCGITMVKPMQEIARIIEKEQNVRITIAQGGSEDLYQSLKTSRKGDLYLPGSLSYRERYLSEGLLGDTVHVGYNQAALVVPKGNPKGVKPDLGELMRDDLSMVVCSPDSGSIGDETKRILDKAGLFDAVIKRSAFLTTDSRNLNNALKEGKAELTLNWRATAFFEENRDRLEAVDLPASVAVPKKLVLNLLTFSQHPDVARRFMAYAASPEGQAIFRKYGFHDAAATFN